MMRVWDTHCHLDCEPLYGNCDRIMVNAREAGVVAIVVPGVHPSGWMRIADLSRVYPEVLPAYGVHPLHAAQLTDDILEQLAVYGSQAVALGEIGLDRQIPVAMERQERAFREQLRLARLLALPVLVHCRGVFQKTLQIMREEQAGRIGGIMHAFSGSVEMAMEFVRLGFRISVSAVITCPQARRLRRLASELPLEHLVLETDAPDLPPYQWGGVNEPALIRHTLSVLAAIRGIDKGEMANRLTDNSCRALGLVSKDARGKWLASEALQE